MSATHLAGRIAAGAMIVMLATGGQLGVWADERTELVRSGSPAAPTAGFVMAGGGESLLAPGSDPRLRVVVDGDLATAQHVAVLVPGVDTAPERFDEALAAGLPAVPVGGSDVWAPGPDDAWWKTMPGWARSLRLAAEKAAPGAADDVAVVAWLGYVTPAGWAGVKPEAMKQGAANLAAFAKFLAQERPDAEVTWICHSYGSLVCASALVQADPDALVLVGSPGVGVDKAADLATGAPVWAGEAGKDLIGLTEMVGLAGGSFGVRPVEAAFGARELPCGADDGHSDYFRPGSPQITAMAAVLLGA